jgi:hypothetical protein
MARSKQNQEAAGAAVAGAPAQRLTKTQAIAEALRELGRGANNEDLAGYARQKFGVEVGTNYVSNIKSTLKSRKRKQAKAAREQGGAGNGPMNGRRKSKRPAAPASDTIALIRAVKALAQRAGGMSELKCLVDVLAE